jgi:hypothetical protein
MYNLRVKSGTNKLARHLGKGKLSPASFEGVLDILLVQKKYADSPEGFKGFAGIAYERTVNYGNDVKVKATAAEEAKAVVVASLITKRDSQYSDKMMEMVLPANLLIIHNEPDQTLSYYSECPADKDHEHLIRNFIERVHQRLV